MNFYFDESGDLGKIETSISKYFVISIYKESTKVETELLVEKIRKDLKIGRKVSQLKWYRLNKEKKLKFAKFYKKILKEKVFIIYINKIELKEVGMKVFEKMITELILEFKLFGNYKYEGEHLSRFLENTRLNLKSKNKKVFFQNSDTNNNYGIQICDLVAGYIHFERENKKDVNYTNVIKYKD